MKRVFLKSTLAAFLSVVVSLLIVVLAVPAIGGVVDKGLLVMCIVCPVLAAWPASAYTFWQSERLHQAHVALEAAHRDLAEAHRQLTEKSRRDHMTGFLNRESFFGELDAYRRRNDGGALLIIDADHFKLINDRHGHLVGDDALSAISAAIGRGVRAGDLIGRIGGEEFATLLFGATREEAIQVAERIRHEVERIVFRPENKGVTQLTVSIGGTQFVSSASVSEHMRAADRQLYEAKHSGRNRTVFDPEIRVAA
jgi:diguanylate cyclase (GGDEF)-like protein